MLCASSSCSAWREQVHRHPVGRRAAVGQHQDLAGAGDHVDADLAEHAALGAGHVGVARAGDLVDARHGLRCRRPARPSACAPPMVKARRHARHMRRGQHQRVLLAARRRHHHDDFADAGHLGRDRVHQHRRRIGGLAAGHVDADAVQRRHLLAQQACRRRRGSSSFRRWPSSAPRGSCGPGAPRPAAHRAAPPASLRRRPCSSAWREFQLRQRGRRKRVEAVGVLQHRRVAALLHVRQDVSHTLLDLRVGFGRPMQPSP